jgi:hypothetical protein
MSECTRLSDRIPLVILGRQEWSVEETRHLGECASCRAEWELVQTANRLGEKVGRRIDDGKVSRVVLARLASVRAARSRSRAWSAAGLAAAAAIAGLIWTGSSVDRTTRVPLPVAALQIPLPELDRLQPAELDSVLQAIDELGAQGRRWTPPISASWITASSKLYSITGRVDVQPSLWIVAADLGSAASGIRAASRLCTGPPGRLAPAAH